MAVKRMDVTLTSNGSGDATCVVTLNGLIVRVVTNPSATAPTDNWDLTLMDDAGLDLFMGQGGDRDTANTEHFCPGLPITDGTTTSVIPVSCNGNVTLTGANMGASKIAVVTIFTRD